MPFRKNYMRPIEGTEIRRVINRIQQVMTATANTLITTMIFSGGSGSA